MSEEEVLETGEEPKTVALSEIEEAATKQGWSPDKGELGALDFLSRGREFRDRLYDDVKELRKDNEKVYGIVAEHITNVQKKEYKEETATIEQQIREASEAGDTDKVIELTKKIPKEPEEVKGDPVVDSWVADNKWFNESQDMQDDAKGFYQTEVMKNNGVDNPAMILPRVEERIKKLYPDYFQPKNSNQERGSGAENKGKQSKGKTSGLTMDDLTEDEAKHIKDFVAMGMKEEKLLKSVENARLQRGQ